MKKSYLFGVLTVYAISAFGAPPRQKLADIEASRVIDESTIITDKKKVGTTAPEIITELPQGGKTIQYSTSQEGLVRPYSGVGPSLRTYLRDVTWYDNGDVYFHNPMVTYISDSYIKGHVEGSKVIVNLPQCIGYIDNGNEPPFYVYMNKLTFDWMDEEEGIGWYYLKEEQNTVEFDIVDGMHLELNLGNEGWDGSMYYGEEAVYSKYIYGMTAGNAVDEFSTWLGYGDGREYYTDLDHDLTVVPENLTTEKWVITSDDQNRLLNIAFDGENVYVNNIFGQELLNSWVKGTISDGVVTFESGQYMGILHNYLNYNLTYLMAADPIWVKYNPNDTESEEGDTSKGYWGLNPVAEISFNYDAQTHTLTPVDEQRHLVVSTANNYISYLIKYKAPTLTKQGDFDDHYAPATPEFISYGELFAVAWNIPFTNVNGDYLDTSRMWYNIYFDGVKYEFMTDEYVKIPEDMIDVPYEFCDGNWDFVTLNEIHRIFLHMSKISEVGVQSFYESLDGTIYSSPLVTQYVRVFDNDHEAFPPVSILNEYDVTSGILTMKWDIPSTGDMETIIDPEIMYYNVTVDGKKIEIDLNGETTSDIPYLHVSDMCEVDGTLHTLTCKFESIPQAVTVQSFFLGEYDWMTGETPIFASEPTTDIVTLRQNSSIGIIDAGFVDEYLMSLSGNRVENPLPGVYVRVRVNYDGTIITDRVLIK
ncbi:MAG: hypothetical protein HDR88_16985 [Bacteroides sp.]|nr:hypothetical protein [Bacteroides sp.]